MASQKSRRDILLGVIRNGQGARPPVRGTMRATLAAIAGTGAAIPTALPPAARPWQSFSIFPSPPAIRTTEGILAMASCPST